MLVLSRKRNEVVCVNHDVEIRVVDIRGDKVRLGITAPPQVPVHRAEVYDRLYNANRELQQAAAEAEAELDAADSMDGGFRR